MDWRGLSVVGVLAYCGIAASEAQAAINPSRCNACSEAAYAARAEADVEARGQAHGYTYVYDMTYNHFRKFSVEREPAGGGGYTYTVTSEAPTAQEMGWWTSAKAAIADNSGSAVFFGHYTQNDAGFPYPNDSIYDMVQTHSHQVAVSNWLQNYSQTPMDNVSLTVDALTKLALDIILKDDVFSTTITITFKDGGKLRMHWQAGQIDFSLFEALDRNNNSIPLNIRDLIGHYDFTGGGGGDDFVAFLQDRYGAGVQTPANVCRNGVLACSSGGGVVSCEWIHCGAIP